MSDVGQSPVDWVGKDVTVYMPGVPGASIAGGWHIGPLKGIGDLGIVLATVTFSAQAERSELTAFYPWHLVHWIRLAEGTDRAYLGGPVPPPTSP